MMSKFFKFCLHLLKKYQRIIRYLFIGVLTTLVNYLIFYLMYYQGSFNSTISNASAVFSAVIFAYITNKLYVFESKTPSFKALLKEAFSFVLSRGFTIFLEIAGVYIMLELLSFNAMISKILISVFVVIINYFLAHYLVFNRKAQ